MTKIEKIVKILRDRGKTISTMESCTGGFVASSITDVPGASKILNFSAITYSNEYKIKMGVSSDIIDKYTVYSSEVSKEMARVISEFALSDYGIGITGKLGKKDPANLTGNDNQVFISIYDRKENRYVSFDLYTYDKYRINNKKQVLNLILDKFYKYLSDEDV